MVGSLRSLGRRSWDLGRHRRRRARRRVHRPPGRSERSRAAGRGSPWAPRRSGDRPCGQLVEPGALRRADQPALGARDRLRAPARRIPLQRDLSPHVPLRGAVESRCCRAPAHPRSTLPLPSAGALRPVRRALHGLPLLPRDAPDRPVRGDCRHARERLGVRGPVRPLPCVLHLVAVRSDWPARAPAPRGHSGATADDGRSARPRPTTSWTSMRSKAPSICS